MHLQHHMPPPAPADPPADAFCSVIVEWENAHHTDARRTAHMLQALAAQMQAAIDRCAGSFELLVAFDPADTPAAAVEAAVNQAFGAPKPGLAQRLMAAPGSSYYTLKNQAAVQARGDLLVFVDCDVLPQPGWLQQLLLPFEDPRVGVSQGVTVVQPHSLMTAGLALAWLFPLQRAGGGLTETERVVANNIAFRRSTFLACPYPELPTWRGQCTAQRLALQAQGAVIVWSDQARALHPFPKGLAGTVERAFLNGHDHATRHVLATGRQADWRASYWRFAALRRRAAQRRLLMQDELGLASPWARSVCAAVATFYWGCGLLSECLLHLRPQRWRALLKDLPQHAAARAVAQDSAERETPCAS